MKERTYRFNAHTLTYEEIKEKPYRTWFLIGFALMLMGFGSVVKVNRIVEKIPVIIHFHQEECTPDNVKTYINRLNLKYPEIVYQQVMLESNYLTSPLVKSHNNLVCMQNATGRPTLGIDIGTRFAKYNSWKDCLTDYAIWQATFARGIDSPQDYYELLDKIYCPSNLEENKGPLYSTRLKKLSK